MDNSNINQHSPSYGRGRSGQKRCRVCFGTDDDDYESNRIRVWVSPCLCRGPRRWVHQDCFDKNELQCSVCQIKYLFEGDEFNCFVKLLNKLETKVNRLCICLKSVIVGFCFYWAAVCYGAMTIVQVYEVKEGITILGNADTFVMFVVFPSVPISLILFKLFNWEETLLLIFQNLISKIPWLRTIMPSFLPTFIHCLLSTYESHPVFNPLHYRNIYTPLLLPTTALVIGNVLFGYSSYSRIQRTLLGGLVYNAVKGGFRIYLGQQIVLRERRRRVFDYSLINKKKK